LLGHECVKCGYSDKRALQIDHIHGGGVRDRKKAVSDTAYYKHILEVGAIEFQILCANCNFIKRLEDKEVSPSKWRNGRQYYNQLGLSLCPQEKDVNEVSR